MIDYYHYRPDHGSLEPQDHDQIPEAPHRLHPLRRLLKWLLIIFLVVVLIMGIVATVGYFYIQNTTLAQTNDRTNILVMGVDDTADLTDTLMLISILHGSDGTNEVALLSIPRDLYLAVPGYHAAKINSAYAIGERNDHPGGGANLTAETIEHHFQLPLHYYFGINFEGFEKIVDGVGGVEIDVEVELDDPRYPDDAGGYDPLHIEAGEHTFDGETALKYARSRKSTNDFDRAYRQQQILLAVQEELTHDIERLNLRNSRAFFNVFNQHVDTDMNLQELVLLARVIHGINQEQAPQYVLDSTNLLTGTTNETGSALIPRTGDFSEIQEFVDQIFTQTDVDEFARQQF